jgi:hypothetical protein
MGKTKVWKDVKNNSIEGREDQSMEGWVRENSMEGCAGPQYGRRERSKHGRMRKSTVWKHGHWTGPKHRMMSRIIAWRHW